MKKYKYFSMSELCYSFKAQQLHIDNTPNEEQKKALDYLITSVLDPLRELWGAAIQVTSGFRCNALNSKVGGATNSQHKAGQAADIVTSSKAGTMGNYLLARKLLESDIEFDQLILEDVGKDNLLPMWLHISTVCHCKNRNQILKKIRGKKGYIPITRKEVLG